MPHQSVKSELSGVEMTKRRNQLVLDQAKSVGLIGAAKDARVSGRVSGHLLAAAKARAQVSSDTDLIELALSRLALEDDFGVKLLRREGSVPKGLDLEF
ncbi:hypothetical protein SAMN06265338_1185 [Rhodoblastus acidophilus]|uniref:Uncharacterized protein n=1 Tax=Rhodoblastus acidophilus TaxID=1074 RepID=A0A212S9L9_RHOAC|nr:hypothetical protein [Rhodoblastus acidophilus]PPQ36083.1 hypothetical protein CKO16_19035 [Rhodoblastus acidophilus]RAI18798.1 hypothetical protein CH337_13510 [Rhodoblastus acidophilus]SNB82098.1 hypothetical protein SAMN06265338_1185 [Rhodoblastus acidophilus]